MKHLAVNKNLRFQYDTLIDRHNICDRNEEAKTIARAVASSRPVVLFAPRRYGKTSLIMNVVAADHVKKKKSSALHVNLMGVDSLQSIAMRLQEAVADLFATTLPARTWLASVVKYFQNLKVTVSVDSMTGLPSLEISGAHQQPSRGFKDLFGAIKKLGTTHALLLIFDEFQDIHAIPEAEALLRSHLQTLTKESIVILGSRHDLLYKMFSQHKSPFFGFGDELHLQPISLHDWVPYFATRLRYCRSQIETKALEKLLELMHNVPNAISESGAWLSDNYSDQFFDFPKLVEALDLMVKRKQHSFHFQIMQLSAAERSVLQAIALRGYTAHITSGAFLKEVKPAASATKKIVTRLEDRGILEWEQELGYRLSDPILRYFIVRHPLCP